MLLDLLAPPECAACLARVARSRAFCTGCAATITRDHGEAAFLYGGALQTAITRWKFEGALGVGSVLGRLFAAELAPRLPPGALLAPVPLHPRRLAERGFNPAQLLARALARGARVPLWPELLRRVRDTPKQSTLGRAERLTNLDAAFVATRAVPAGATVVLIDDVSTTGSTLAACRVALRLASPTLAAIGAAILARTPDPRGLT